MKGRNVPEARLGMVWDRKTGEWRKPQRDGLTAIHRHDARRQAERKARQKAREEVTA